jgi:hypothetical protein
LLQTYIIIANDTDLKQSWPLVPRLAKVEASTSRSAISVSHLHALEYALPCHHQQQQQQQRQQRL